MWKYAVVGVAAFGATSLINLAVGDSRPAETARARAPTLVEEMKIALHEVNKKRGEKKGPVTFDGARLNGTTLIYDMLVPNPPRGVNLTKGTERIQSLMEKEMCRGKYAGFLKRGAAIVFIYKTTSGRELYDSRVDAAICRLPV